MTHRERLEKIKPHDLLRILCHTECAIALLEQKAYTDFSILQRCHYFKTCEECIDAYLDEESINEI